MADEHSSPLRNVRVLDLSALGPGPFASMMLADFGAEVLSIGRPDAASFDPSRNLRRGKGCISVDLRSPAGASLVRSLALEADVLLEGFRPGVLEKYDLGPKPLLEANPRLIYARLTGWGQTGPYASRAGHDINYLAISGALAVSGIDRPIAPPALLGDIGNGSYMAVIGITMALYDRTRTGRGREIDIAITDGAALMLSALFGEVEAGHWTGVRGEHLLSGAAPFYGVYLCADGRWFSVGAIEHKFYVAFLDVLEIADVDRTIQGQWDRSAWPSLRARIAERFAAGTQDLWTAAFNAADACGAPVLELSEIESDPHHIARGTVRRSGLGLRARAAPRLSDSLREPSLEALSGSETRQLMRRFGISDVDLDRLLSERTVVIG